MPKKAPPTSRPTGPGLGLRRLRLNGHVRALVREVDLSVDQLVQPLFVAEANRKRKPIAGLADVYQESADSLLRQVESDLKQGVSKFLLFGVPASRRTHAIDWSYTASQIAALKRRFGDAIWLATDVCLCSATPHGHCGVLSAEGDHVDNRASVAELVAAAVAYAEAGADCVAPSDMMDGRIGAIRAGLEIASCERTVLMSYAVKFASALYGPFRVAAESAPSGSGLHDRRSYQLDPARRSDAWLCAERDAAEGADILMVKPGIAYLDLLRELSQHIRLPWAVYQVSGEYAAFDGLAHQGLAGRAALHRELWTAFRRAGAQIIITYGARHAREWLAA